MIVERTLQLEIIVYDLSIRLKIKYLKNFSELKYFFLIKNDVLSAFILVQN